MKLPILTVVGIGMAALLVQAADQDKPKENPAFKTPKEKISYTIGINIANNFKRQEVDVDPDLVARGIQDGLAGRDPLLTEKERIETMTSFQAEMRAKADEKRKLLEEKRKVVGEKNKKEGEAFLAENKKKAGVMTTPSGLQYKVIKEGAGPIPKSTDEVTANYRGTSIDGTEFDNSNKNTLNASTFRITGVVKGWQEALQMMKVGSKWQLFIPPDLAYREFGKGTNIGPNATLIFDLELLSAKPVTNAPAPMVSSPRLSQPAVTSDIIKVPSAEELKKGAKIEVIKADTLEKK